MFDRNSKATANVEISITVYNEKGDMSRIADSFKIPDCDYDTYLLVLKEFHNLGKQIENGFIVAGKGKY